jgi:hypothetical protein
MRISDVPHTTPAGGGHLMKKHDIWALQGIFLWISAIVHAHP